MHRIAGPCLPSCCAVGKTPYCNLWKMMPMSLPGCLGEDGGDDLGLTCSRGVSLLVSEIVEIYTVK